MRYVGDRPFATPEGAARKLLEIVPAKDIAVGQYPAGRRQRRRIRRGAGLWDRAGLVRDRGTRIILLQSGADL
jgi:hypothetical protein